MNGYNFTDRVRKVLHMARDEAVRLGQHDVGTEHMLLALIREGDGVAAAVLTNLSVDCDEIQSAIERTVKKDRGAPPSGPDLPYASRAKKVLELAMMEARDLNHSYVGTEHLLLGLIGEQQGIAAQMLSEAGVTIELARAETLRLLGEAESGPASRLVALEADQRFKTGIAVIELHRLRFGSYPDSFEQLEFLGGRDASALLGLKYEKLPDGYALDVVGHQTGIPDDGYPPDFWRGLGIRRTNVPGGLNL